MTEGSPEPTQPTQPTEPAQPTEPTQPTDTTDTTQPTTPTPTSEPLTGTAASLEEAMQQEAEQTNNVGGIGLTGLGGEYTEGRNYFYQLQITHDGTQPAIRIAYLDTPFTDDSGGRYTLDAKQITETLKETDDTVFIQTDIDPPTSTPLTDVYPYDVRLDGQAVSDTQKADAISVARKLSGRGNLGGDQNTAEAIRARTLFFAADGRFDVHEDDAAYFMTCADATMSCAAVIRGTDRTYTAKFENGDELPGTLSGARGTYTCITPGLKCRVRTDSSGTRVQSLSGWAFAPEREGSTIAVQDTDYLYYGVWASQRDDGSYEEVQSFAGSRLERTDQAAVTQLGSTATYTGGAAGFYQRAAATGDFTATVNLTADFNDDTIAGEVTNFSGDAAGWTVTLNQTTFAGVKTFTGSTQDGSGNWAGAFYGPKAAVVVGEFDAEFDDGRLLGGFGARKQ